MTPPSTSLNPTPEEVKLYPSVPCRLVIANVRPRQTFLVD